MDMITGIPPLDAIKFASTSFAVLFVLYAYFVYTKWDKDFSGQRLARTSKESPSNNVRPDVDR